MTRVLVGCEFSGVVRDAFRARGHDAWSCDLLPTESPGPHLQCDVRLVLGDRWDLLIAHPPCTYLARSGVRWWKGREAEQAEALAFFRLLLDAPIPRIAVENPIGAAYRIRRPDQLVRPWYFGDPEKKATALWLHGLPPLMATVVETGREARVHRAAPGPDRWKVRSRTCPGVAAAMAAQWGAP
jgi:hypothetical protein